MKAEETTSYDDGRIREGPDHRETRAYDVPFGAGRIRHQGIPGLNASRSAA